MSDAQFYIDHIHASSSGYRATWEPGTKLRIGDIIKLDKYNVCNVFSNLEDHGITPNIRASHSTSNKDYTYGSGLEINLKLAGKTPEVGSALTAADAGFNIQFKNGKNIVFKVNGYTEEQIVNLETIEAAIIEKYKNGKWDKDWLIITNLTTADSATIIISEQGNSTVDIKATANVNAGPMEITDASLGLQFVGSKNTTTNILAQNGITPLYKAMGLKISWLGKKELDTRSLDDFEEDEEESKTEEYSLAEIAS